MVEAQKNQGNVTQLVRGRNKSPVSPKVLKSQIWAKGYSTMLLNSVISRKSFMKQVEQEQPQEGRGGERRMLR